MKKSVIFSTLGLIIALMTSCDAIDSITGKSDKLSGNPSPMGAVGVTISTTSAAVAGVSNFSGTVTASNDGVSTYSGQVTVTNNIIKSYFTNIPGVTVSGDLVTISNVRFKNTTDGIELLTGPSAGILVKYDSNVGDTYKIGSTGLTRVVTSKSTTDDYPYGYYNIKVIKVEESAISVKAATGLNKITYWANHKFGLVGIQFTFDDQTTAKFPVYTSAQNN